MFKPVLQDQLETEGKLKASESNSQPRHLLSVAGDRGEFLRFSCHYAGNKSCSIDLWAMIPPK